jgi:hypothetical protein
MKLSLPRLLRKQSPVLSASNCTKSSDGSQDAGRMSGLLSPLVFLKSSPRLAQLGQSSCAPLLKGSEECQSRFRELRAQP